MVSEYELLFVLAITTWATTRYTCYIEKEHKRRCCDVRQKTIQPLLLKTTFFKPTFYFKRFLPLEEKSALQ